MGSNQDKLYNDSIHPDLSKVKKDWLKDIDNQTHLSQMTIPGTHDSCSLFGINSARTQSWTLNDQLDAGIRYLNLKLRIVNNKLRAYHAFVDQKETLDSILKIVFKFLEKNATECVIMEINSENTPLNSTKSFAELYEEYIQNYKNKIIEYDNKDITLGELRGKLYIIKAFEGKLDEIPGIFSQNDLQFGSGWDINKKENKIKEFFNRVISLESNNENNNFITNKEEDKKNLYIAYISYLKITPYGAASRLNNLVKKYSGRLGIVNSDYPGEDLINHLIQQNKRNENKENKIIKNGDNVYLIHNDTGKYLCVNGEQVYLTDAKQSLVITYKENPGEDNNSFKKGDEITLSENNNMDFKIDEIFLGRDGDLYKKTLFMLQKKNNENNYEYMSSSFDKKDNNGNYSFDLKENTNIEDFSCYFFIEKVEVP